MAARLPMLLTLLALVSCTRDAPEVCKGDACDSQPDPDSDLPTDTPQDSSATTDSIRVVDTDAVPTYPPCPLTTPRVIHTAGSPLWYTGGTNRYYVRQLGPHNGSTMRLWIMEYILPPGQSFGSLHFGPADVGIGQDISAVGRGWVLPQVSVSLVALDYSGDDLDSDGRSDAFITYSATSTSTASINATALHVISGNNTGTLDPADSDWRFPIPEGTIYTSSMTGDFNQDGHVDLALGLGELHDPNDRVGSYDHFVRIYAGPFTQGEVQLSNPFATIDLTGVKSRTVLHQSPTDVNGDGADDLLFIVAQDGEYSSLLFQGPFSGELDLGSATASFVLAEHHRVSRFNGAFGYPSANGADFDGDGILDLAIGMHEVDRGRGLAVVFRGPFQGRITSDEAYLRIRGEDGLIDAVGFQIGFIDVGAPPAELVFASRRDANSQYHVFTGDQQGDLRLEDARITILNDDPRGILAANLGDLTGNGNPDLVLATNVEANLVSLCP